MCHADNFNGKIEKNLRNRTDKKEKIRTFALDGFYGISTIVGYLMPNTLYTFILNNWFGWVHGISNILAFLMLHPLQNHTLNIWFG